MSQETNGHAMPSFPYGAVYFRKSNPPREDWERDYAVAAEDGHNGFRHWFLWSAVELAPGEFDWADYDAQLDLAATHGLKTVVAEMVTAAPEWAFRRLAHARFVRRDGSPVNSMMSGSCVTGGFPGLCLDNADAREAAGRFLTELVTRYRGHAGLGGYDIWNECGYLEDACYCPATAARFRTWLQDKYGDLRVLGKVWGRHSFADWDDVLPPTGGGAYADVLDWLRFRRDNAYELMAWRRELIRGLDPDHPITAHGIAGSLFSAASRGTDDWRAAAEADSYGLTWGSSRHGDSPWQQFHAMDLVRCASRGKPFWHAEAYAGPLWMQPQVTGRPRDDGRIASVEDIRYWNLVSFAGGATGLFYLRWRPLLDGPLFGAFGAYGMDGSRTDRSAMVSALAHWATNAERAPLWQSGPVRGDVGIVYVPETQDFVYAQQGSAEFYTRAVRGAYQGFFDNNVQADFVHIDDIDGVDGVDGYSFLYLPLPVMLSEQTAAKLARWVRAGGTLVSEGCPAYFGDHGRVGTTQPNYGLDELFGARESYVEFTPDLLEDLTLTVAGHRVFGGVFLQAYVPTTGSAAGAYSDGKVAAVDHAVGRGRTRLVGSFPSVGYARHGDAGTRGWFADLLAWAGLRPRVRVTNPAVTARLHDGAGGRSLWVLNPTRAPQRVTVSLAAEQAPIKAVTTHWGEHEATVVDERTIDLTLDARDGHVAALG